MDETRIGTRKPLRRRGSASRPCPPFWIGTGSAHTEQRETSQPDICFRRGSHKALRGVGEPQEWSVNWGIGVGHSSTSTGSERGEGGVAWVD